MCKYKVHYHKLHRGIAAFFYISFIERYFLFCCPIISVELRGTAPMLLVPSLLPATKPTKMPLSKQTNKSASFQPNQQKCLFPSMERLGKKGMLGPRSLTVWEFHDNGQWILCRKVESEGKKEAKQWLIQYRIYVKFGGILGSGSEWSGVCCMSAKVFERLGIS